MSKDFEVFHCLVKSEVFRRDAQRVNSSQPQFLNTIMDENGELASAEDLKYFHLPPPSTFPLNLNCETEEIRFRLARPFKPSLSKLQKYLIENDGHNFFKNTKKQQVITSRSGLRVLMCFPYRQNFENTVIRITKFGGIFYLACDYGNNDNRKNDAYHFEFQRFCFSNSPHTKPNPGESISDHKALYGLFRYNVDHYEFLYTSDIIGVESKEKFSDLRNMNSIKNWNFVLTKIRRQSPSVYWRKQIHLQNIWIQSYLGCVEDVYFGKLNRTGYVKKVKKCVKVQTIPSDCCWEPEICKRFLRDFFSKAEKEMSHIDCPYTVYEFLLDQNIHQINYRVFKGKTEHSFLSEEFIKYIQMK